VIRQIKSFAGRLGAALLVSAGQSVALAAGCGARTGLETFDSSSVQDGSPSIAEAGSTVAPRDVFVDDALVDSGGNEDDAMSADVSLPPIDAGRGLAEASNCSDISAYVVTAARNLYAFDPLTAAFTLVGPLVCPIPAGSWRPFSMAVDRQGTAYVFWVDSDTQGGFGGFYRISTVTAECAALDQPSPPAGLS
jgi:hypothetical protein